MKSFSRYEYLGIERCAIPSDNLKLSRVDLESQEKLFITHSI